MKIDLWKKGQVADPYPLPEGGWGKYEAPDDGLVFRLNPDEKMASGFFLIGKELAKVGYANFDSAMEHYMKFTKTQLQNLAIIIKLSTKGNKTQIIKRILRIE